MIAYLKGNLLRKNGLFLILDVNGIGYKIHATPELLSKPIGSALEVHTYHKSTDQEQALYGMESVEALEFFELLLTVTGIGPKSAIGIISSSKINVLKNAISNQDISLFTKIAGVGKKSAERIILELKNKIGSIQSISSHGSEVFDALTALGYSQKEIKQVLESLPSELNLEDQIKYALKYISK